jgi:hypothetical protein
METDGQVLGALLLVTGGRVDLRRKVWRGRPRPAPAPAQPVPKPRTGRPALQDGRSRKPKLVHEQPHSRTCSDCGATKPVDAFLPIKRRGPATTVAVASAATAVPASATTRTLLPAPLR